MNILENGTEVYVNDQYEIGYAIIRGLAIFDNSIWYIIETKRLISKVGLKSHNYECEIVPENAVRPVFPVLQKK